MKWLVRLLVDEPDRRAIDADLAELYEVRRHLDGDRAAARWLRRQRFFYPVHLLAERARVAIRSRVSVMTHIWKDLAYSARVLLRTPGLTLTILLTVGVGLGATTAMVSVVRAVLISPLPYSDADNIYWVYTDNPPFRFRFSVVDYRALEADHPTLAEVAAYQSSGVTLSVDSVAERASAKSVTGSYFPLMRQRAVLGRLFDPRDDSQTDRIAVLTEAYWANRFARDPGVLGRSVLIDGVSHTVVGVLERSNGPLERNVAVFTAARWPAPRRKGPFFTMVLTRLQPGISREAATSAIHAVNRRLFPIWKTSYQDEKATWGLQDLKSRTVGDIGSTLYLALAAVAAVLLISCANAINLLVARALSRGRELAIRTALGASRGRLLQQLLTETGLFTVGAALIGATTAVVGIRVLIRPFVQNPRIDEVAFSAPVIAWLGLLSLASGLLIFAGSWLPAIAGARTSTTGSLRIGGRSMTDGPAARRARRVLVAAEFALATPLLVAAVLVIASLNRLANVPIGMDMTHVLTAGVSLSGPRYEGEAERAAFWNRAIEKLAAIPGVTSAAIVDSRPPEEAGQTNNFDLEDRPTPPGQNQPLSTWVGATPGFFKTAGLTLQQGRLLDEKSLQQDVVVVDRAWADRFFPDGNVVGRRLRSGGCTTCPWTTVVGVVGTVKYQGLDARDEGTVYFPFVDLPSGFAMLRTSGDPASLASSLRAAIQELDPSLALAGTWTGEQLIASSLSAPRSLTLLVGVFALAALILAVVGIYGVMAYFVQQHTRDIGIRLALGGDPSAVRMMVVMQGLRFVGAGVFVGLGVAMATSRLVESVLFEVAPRDPWVLTAVPLTLVAVAVIACLVPGRRAAKLDPAMVLRE